MGPPQIDGALEKPFWRDPPHSFLPLRNMANGEKPTRVKTRTTFRWVPRENALVVAVECFEPNMDKLVAKCQDRDSQAIFADDFVEIQLTSNAGISPQVAVNPGSGVYDACAPMNPEDSPLSYTVRDVAVKKYPDRWTVEVRIDAETISGTRPTPSYPWGANVCRQRLAGDAPEHYVLSPGGSSFRDKTCMANLHMRK